MYEQRTAEPPAAFEREPHRAWQPPAMPVAPDFALDGTERYVAVDRIDEGLAILSIAPWPMVDPETGRLTFGPADDRETRAVAVEQLRRRARAGRAAAGLPDRPIRVGDAFLVRGLRGLPSRWDLVVDITRSARLAAKAALLSTVAPAPPVERLGAFGMDEPGADDTLQQATATSEAESGDGPPPGPVAFPAV
jgi:hypothetical protein